MAAIACALFCAGAYAQGAAPSDKSSTMNNSANRATDPTGGENEAFRKVPGGKATAKKDWKKGDPRGKPQKPRVSRKHVKEKLKKQKEAQK